MNSADAESSGASTLIVVSGSIAGASICVEAASNGCGVGVALQHVGVSDVGPGPIGIPWQPASSVATGGAKQMHTGISNRASAPASPTRNHLLLNTCSVYRIPASVL